MTNHNKRSNCTTCFHSVSETEATCPSCGARVSAKRDHFGFWALGSFWMFNVAMAAWYWTHARTGFGKAHGQNAEPPLPWLVLDSEKVIIIWISGALLLGALTLFSRAK